MTKNVAASIRQKLLNHARENKVDFQQVLTRFGLERLLYRLAKSPEHDQFILKGAMLFELWLNLPHRPTRDLDFLAFGNPNPTEVAKSFRQILSQPVTNDDGIVFDLNGIKASEIRKAAGYPGVRVTLKASLDNAAIPIQCDLGFGDVITPGPLSAEYPVLLDLPSPQLLVYPAETVVAEKLEAMVKLDERNSRIKDYFDIWILLKHDQVDHSQLVNAIAATFACRGTQFPSELPAGLKTDFAVTRNMQWQQFIKRNRLAAPDLETVIETLAERCWPLMKSAAKMTKI